MSSHMVLVDGGSWKDHAAASHWPNRQRAQGYWNLLSAEHPPIKATVEDILARLGHGNYPALIKELTLAMINAEKEPHFTTPADQVCFPLLAPEADKPLAKWVLHPGFSSLYLPNWCNRTTLLSGDAIPACGNPAGGALVVSQTKRRGESIGHGYQPNVTRQDMGSPAQSKVSLRQAPGLGQSKHSLGCLR